MLSLDELRNALRRARAHAELVKAELRQLRELLSDDELLELEDADPLELIETLDLEELEERLDDDNDDQEE